MSKTTTTTCKTKKNSSSTAMTSSFSGDQTAKVTLSTTKEAPSTNIKEWDTETLITFLKDKNSKLDEDDFQLLHKEKIAGAEVLKMTEEELHRYGLPVGSAIRIKELIEEIKPKTCQFKKMLSRGLFTRTKTQDEEIIHLAKRFNLDIEKVPKYLKENASLLLKVIDKMKVDDPAWIIEWTQPFPRNGSNQTKNAIVAHITNPRWGGIDEFSKNIVFTFREGRDLSECEEALPSWVRRQTGTQDVGISFRMNKMLANGRTDLELYNFAFNR